MSNHNRITELLDELIGTVSEINPCDSNEDKTNKATTMTLIPKKITYIVHGYMRKNNTFFKPIADICLNFYFKMGFYTEKHGDNLYLLNNYGDNKTDILARNERKDGWSICLYDPPIDSAYCDFFNIHISWWNAGCSLISIGYITSTINDSIKKWDSHLGVGENQQNSIGLLIDCDETYICYNKDNETKALDYYTKTPFANNDNVFVLSFNFKLDTFTVFHNKNKVDVLSLHNVKSITPAFALCGDDDTIEIIKCCFGYYS